jgi:hypothetical protein
MRFRPYPKGIDDVQFARMLALGILVARDKGRNVFQTNTK